MTTTICFNFIRIEDVKLHAKTTFEIEDFYDYKN